MPWAPSDALAHTKKADTEQLKKLWAGVANDVLKDTGNEAKAITEANAVVERAALSQKKRRKI